LRAGECQVWWARTDAARDELAALLDGGERARLSRFRRAEDRARYLAAHVLTRLVLAAHLGMAPAALRFVRMCRHCGAVDHGKPRLGEPAGIDFSLSHSGGRVVLAVARGGAVGVDVERLRAPRDLDGLIAAALSPGEQAVVTALPAAERSAALLRSWTRKEALLKATGDGLAVALPAVIVTPPDAPPALVAWEAARPLDSEAHLFDLTPGEGHVASLAVLGPRLAVVECSADRLLAAARRAAAD
jgi:4'-phosphopantetheinyl transferase